MVKKAFTGGEKLEAHLRELAAKVTNPGTLEVGFPEGSTYPDGTLTAAVAAFNEFGVPSHNQPPRPFIRGMIASESSHWGKDVGDLLRRTNYDATAALEVMGEEIKSEMQDSIRNFSDPPLAPSTIKAKGFAKPLVETGHMLNSVTAQVRKQQP
jgi:hypothetical protein